MTQLLGPVAVAAFIACSVEVVEMVIIVVGVGAARGWRSTVVGAGSGLAVLAAIVFGLGRALQYVPINPLRVVIGSLLLTFGLQWLTRGVLGVAAKGFTGGDEEEGADAGGAGRSDGVLDWTAWLLAFKGVLLEGLEVAFIVIAFGAGGGNWSQAYAGAAAAFVIIGTVGLLAKGWLEKVPGHALKFGVGGLLSTFGTFWAMDGLGVQWPGEKLSLLWLYLVFLATTFALAWWARHGLGQRQDGSEQDDSAQDEQQAGQQVATGRGAAR